MNKKIVKQAAVSACLFAGAAALTTLPPIYYPELLPTIAWGFWGILVGVVYVLVQSMYIRHSLE